MTDIEKDFETVKEAVEELNPAPDAALDALSRIRSALEDAESIARLHAPNCAERIAELERELREAREARDYSAKMRVRYRGALENIDIPNSNSWARHIAHAALADQEQAK